MAIHGDKSKAEVFDFIVHWLLSLYRHYAETTGNEILMAQPRKWHHGAWNNSTGTSSTSKLRRPRKLRELEYKKNSD